MRELKLKHLFRKLLLFIVIIIGLFASSVLSNEYPDLRLNLIDKAYEEELERLNESNEFTTQSYVELEYKYARLWDIELNSLGHDLGHTPFGHAGEEALQRCLDGVTTFNHNVQSVWIVRQTLCGRKDIYGNQYPGFNLTYDVCEGIWKHTNYKNTCEEIPYLYYYNPSKPASLEGQIVDIADKIAYLKHDIEDGIRNKLLSCNDLKDVWNKYSDIPFNKQNWNHYLIYDVIESSQDKDSISFSYDMERLYKEVEELIIEKVIKSPIVKQKDQEGIEKICTIYEFCIENPDYVLNKFPSRNDDMMNNYGIERVIVDYIQWLGDENANQVYERITKGESIDSTVNYSYDEKMEY